MPLPIVGLAGSVFGWFSAWFTTAIAKTIVDKVIMFLAIKAILSFLFIIIVPIILNNLLYDLLEIIKNYMISATAGTSNFDGAMSFNGILAWLNDCFQISSCISIIVGAMQFRLVISMIPFVGSRL